MKKILKFLLIIVFTLTIAGCDFLFEEEQFPYEEALSRNSGKRAFEYANDNYLYFIHAKDNIQVTIDSSLGADYIEASKIAIELYNSLPGITIGWKVVHPSLIIWGGVNYDLVIISHYRSSDKNICSDDDSLTLACNTFWFDSDGGIYASEILFNLDVIDEDADILIITAIAIHELGHTFGLKDIYQDSLAEHTIMYYQIDTDFPVIITLTELDKSNLAWRYKKE